MAGLLTYSSISPSSNPSHPISGRSLLDSGSRLDKRERKRRATTPREHRGEITAAGTVQVLHLFPFSPIPFRRTRLRSRRGLGTIHVGKGSHFFGRFQISGTDLCTQSSRDVKRSPLLVSQPLQPHRSSGESSHAGSGDNHVRYHDSFSYRTPSP